MVGDYNVFMLSVIGDSMIEAGIHDGDYVIVKQQQTANNGDIVVAMTEDDEATVNAFTKKRIIFGFNRKTRLCSLSY